jgi:hypothetical protein
MLPGIFAGLYCSLKPETQRKVKWGFILVPVIYLTVFLVWVGLVNLYHLVF